MEDNSAWADELLRRVRASADPRPSNEARVLAGLERRLGMAAPVHVTERRSGSGAPLAERAAAASRLTRLARPLGLGALFGLATGAVGYWWGAHSQPVRLDSAPPALSVPAEAAQPALLVPAPRPLAAPEATEEPPQTPLAAAAAPPGPRTERASIESVSKQAAPGRARPLARSRTRTPASSEDANNGADGVARTKGTLTLREAIEQLQRAQTALRRGEALEALELVSQLDQSSPRNLLREERLATRALALCEMGDVSSAREVLLELEGNEAQSIYRARLEAGCGLTAMKSK